MFGIIPEGPVAFCIIPDGIVAFVIMPDGAVMFVAFIAIETLPSVTLGVTKGSIPEGGVAFVGADSLGANVGTISLMLLVVAFVTMTIGAFGNVAFERLAVTFYMPPDMMGTGIGMF